MNIFENFEHNLYYWNFEFESQCCIDEIATLYSQSFPKVTYSGKLSFSMELT